MKQEKRIAIIGPPGSGKSTFAIKLGKLLNIPAYHLDRYMFEGTKKTDKNEFISAKEKILSNDAWIVEGCSYSTFEMRFATADTVIYLDFSRMLCIWRVLKRLLTFDVHLSESGCLKGVNWLLLKYIWNFERDKRERIEELCERYPEVNFLIFHRPEDLDAYLIQLSKREINV